MQVPVLHSTRCIEATIPMRAVIDDRGQVSELKALKSDHKPTWPKRLIDEAMHLVRRRYTPFQIGGKNAAIKTVLRVQCREAEEN